MIKKWLLYTVGVVLLLGWVAESHAAPKEQRKKTVSKEQPRMGGTLVFGLAKGPGNPNPFIQTSSTTQFVREATYESLLTRDDDDKIVPNLAAAYEVMGGGTQFKLRLRKGVRFHNLKEMTADDVIWSANHVKDPKNGAFGQNLMNDVKAVDKIDDYTVRFVLSKASVAFLDYLTNIRMLPIIPANSLQPGQVRLEKNLFVAGTGPFILEQHQSGFDTVLKRFPEYWNGAAYLDKIIFRPIADGANRFNALRTGDVQMADRVAPLDAARVRKGDVKGIQMLDEPLGGFQRLIFNYDNPILQKLEMRQAISFATDKQRLVDEAYFGAATKADLMMDPQGIWTKATNLPPHKRDLAKAKALLKAAGYSGQELVLIGRKSAAQYLESYQRMLGEAAIKVKVEVLEDGVMRERATEGKYDLFTRGGDSTPDPVSTMSPHYYSNKVEKGSYSNPKADRLLDRLDSEFDQKKRLKIFKEFAETLRDDVADIPLLFEIRYVGMSDKVRGYGPPQDKNYAESGEYFKKVWLK